MRTIKLGRLVLAPLVALFLLACSDTAAGPTGLEAPGSEPTASSPGTSGTQDSDDQEAGDTDTDGQDTDDDGQTPDSDATTAVTLLLTDAPGDVQSAWANISEIYLQGGDAHGRLILFEGETGYIELLALADSATSLVDSLEIPAGSYGQLRLVIDEMAIQLESGDAFVTAGATAPDTVAPENVVGELRCPGCSTSGFKVLLQGRDLSLEDTEELLVLDFDVEESFRQAGKSGAWVVKPVIKLFDSMEDTE